MTIIILIWSGTMFFIYTSYVQSIAKQNYAYLKEYAHLYISQSFADDENPGNKSDISDKPEYELTTFYTVAFSRDGTTFETMNDKPAVHSNEELEQLAKEIISSDKEVGVSGSLIYYFIDKGTYDLVVFMDNAVINERYSTFLHYFWMYNLGTFAFCILLSLFISNMVVRPLEKNYKYQKQFVSNAGHELKTPVSVISANAEILERNIGKNQWLSNIQYENERMGLLIGHLLDLSRSEAVKPEMEQLNFTQLVEGEILPFESIAYEKGLTIVSKLQSDVNVYGDSEQLKHVISVLVDNAIEHCNKKSSEIEVLLKKEFLGYARLRVINSGEAISKSAQEKIFERFYRLDKSHNSECAHYGLGLAIAKNIVDSHKGKINVLCYNGKVEFQVLIPINKSYKFY